MFGIRISLFSIIIFILSIIFNLNNVIEAKEKSVVFRFPEFDYKETSKNELFFREMELYCEESPYCENLHGLERTKCIRKCISPNCYNDIYQFNELEEGEIDVRLNSFKGCLIQKNRV